MNRAAALIIAMFVLAQPSALFAQVEGRTGAAIFVINVAGETDDPAYSLYREGYARVLEERWEEARATFSTLARRFPNSPLTDDAAYWSAFCLKQLDTGQAIEAYTAFLRGHRGSPYFEDALADLSALRAREFFERPGMPPPPSSLGGFPAEPPNFRAMEHDLRRMERALRAPLPLPGEIHVRITDPALQAQMDTVFRLSGANDGAKAFQELRRLALDPAGHVAVRMQALERLADFRGAGSLTVFIDVARQDTSEVVREMAIFGIPSAAPDQERALRSLEELYGSFPEHAIAARIAVLDAVADLRTDRAADFLIQVARSAPSPMVQSTAIGYLGIAATDKRKAVSRLIALYEGLPKDRDDVRATTLYALADLGTDRAVTFLLRVARSSPDPSLRRDATTYLGSMGSDAARRAFRTLLQDRR
jgi:tetratricopeptide (TPR) repeat protein